MWSFGSLFRSQFVYAGTQGNDQCLVFLVLVDIALTSHYTCAQLFHQKLGNTFVPG